MAKIVLNIFGALLFRTGGINFTKAKDWTMCSSFVRVYIHPTEDSVLVNRRFGVIGFCEFLMGVV